MKKIGVRVIHVIILNRTCTCACKFIKDYFIWSFVCNIPPPKKKNTKRGRSCYCLDCVMFVIWLRFLLYLSVNRKVLFFVITLNVLVSFFLDSAFVLQRSLLSYLGPWNNTTQYVYTCLSCNFFFLWSHGEIQIKN